MLKLRSRHIEGDAVDFLLDSCCKTANKSIIMLLLKRPYSNGDRAYQYDRFNYLILVKQNPFLKYMFIVVLTMALNLHLNHRDRFVS